MSDLDPYLTSGKRPSWTYPSADPRDSDERVATVLALDDSLRGPVTARLLAVSSAGVEITADILEQIIVRCREDQSRPSAPLPDPTHDPIVYYLRFGDRVKIGTTTNRKVRFESIPHDELLATEAGGREVEQKRHRQFKGLYVLGEWFRYEQPLRDHIAGLAVNAA
ncbi:MAG: hypothetical protein ACRDMV_01110 [Streptosporangiales bacterium]